MRKNVLIAAMILTASMAMTVCTFPGHSMDAAPITASAACAELEFDDEDPGPMGGLARRQQYAETKALALVGEGSTIVDVDPVFTDEVEFVIYVKDARGRMFTILVTYDCELFSV